jgi:hypothetical protein
MYSTTPAGSLGLLVVAVGELRTMDSLKPGCVTPPGFFFWNIAEGDDRLRDRL